MAPSLALQSISYITTAKLNLLLKKQQNYEKEKRRIIAAVAKKQGPAAKVHILLREFEKSKIQPPPNLSTSDIHQFLVQSRKDPSLLPGRLPEWQIAFETALDVTSRRYEHASLFGRLVTEWLEESDQAPLGSSEGEPVDPSHNMDRKEVCRRQKQWESLVFRTISKSDPAAVKMYLANTFDSTSEAKERIQTSFKSLRESIKSFDLGRLDKDLLQASITDLLRTDQLSRDNKLALMDLKNKPLLLREVLDILNMYIDDLELWSWGDELILVETRRAFNGEIHVYMDEDILQALLLHFIGTKWAVHLKSVFTAFFHSGAWRDSPHDCMDSTARQQRQAFLGKEQDPRANVRNERCQRYFNEFFLSKLPNAFQGTFDSYKDAICRESDVVRSPVAFSQDSFGFRSTSDNHEGADTCKNDDGNLPSATEQSLLRLITTEILVNVRLHNHITVLQSNFKNFGPGLPHATIVAALHFFGVTPFWIKFFEKFLEAPVRFYRDGPNLPVRVCRNGVPMRHRLSDALGEMVLFCLDFAINKATGVNLYRTHDDIWFWGSRSASEDAYMTMLEFTVAMGLRLNREKTGSVDISRTSTPSIPSRTPPLSRVNPRDRLPQGEVHWGFLSLNSAGQWTMNDTLLDQHIMKMQRQLGARQSLFAWVQTWNSYVSHFFSDSLGQPANCLGRTHVQFSNKKVRMVLEELFLSKDLIGDTVIEHMRSKLSEKEIVSEIPDGFFFFPIEFGGLGLRNPLVPLHLRYEGSMEDPLEEVDKAFELAEEDYVKAKSALESGESTSTDNEGSLITHIDFTLDHEEESIHLYKAYINLLDVPPCASIEFTPDVAKAFQNLDLVRTPENDRVLQVYGGDIIEKYGGLEMSEREQLPIRLATMLRDGYRG